MTDEERLRLRFGPYKPPPTRMGDHLECEIRGKLQVGRWSDGPIPWPQARNPRGGGWMLIVCGDLARAIRQESNQAVAHWFGGNVKTVSQWRRALGVKASTEGTKELRRAWVPFMVTPEETALGLERSRTSPARHIAHPVSCKANLKARHPNARAWTPDELKLLRQMADRQIAARLGISTNAVAAARKARNIAPFEERVWKNRRDELVELDVARLLAQRVALNLPQKVVGARFGKVAYYAKLELGQAARVRPSTLEALARALECKPEELTHC